MRALPPCRGQKHLGAAPAVPWWAVPPPGRLLCVPGTAASPAPAEASRQQRGSWPGCSVLPPMAAERPVLKGAAPSGGCTVELGIVTAQVPIWGCAEHRVPAASPRRRPQRLNRSPVARSSLPVPPVSPPHTCLRGGAPSPGLGCRDWLGASWNLHLLLGEAGADGLLPAPLAFPQALSAWRLPVPKSRWVPGARWPLQPPVSPGCHPLWVRPLLHPVSASLGRPARDLPYLPGNVLVPLCQPLPKALGLETF